MPSGHLCVIYHLYDADPIYHENFLHFLTFGYVSDADYFVVIAGNETPGLPRAPNVTYLSTSNHNLDYGGYSLALSGEVPLERYDYFIFANCSVRGPYLPDYARSSWVDMLLQKLTEEVALVGTSINILSPTHAYTAEFQLRHGGTPPFSHVQSSTFALSRRRLKDLINHGVFTYERGQLAKTHIITDCEILMSQLLIRDGFNIRCLLPEYNAIDYRRAHRDPNPSSINGDPSYEGAYFGRTMHPFECLFVKTNRNLYPMHFFDKLTYSMIVGDRASESAALGDPTITQYVQQKLSATRFDLPMPSVRDQVARAKLGQIVTSIHSILSERKADT